MSLKHLAFPTVLWLSIFIGAAITTKADTIVINFGDLGPTSIFTFQIPQGQFVVGATLTGTVIASPASSVTPRPIGFGVSVEGVSVGQGLITADLPFSIMLDGAALNTPQVLARFNDGDARFVYSNYNNLNYISIRGQLILTTSTTPLPTPTPEPATMLLLATGLTGLAAKARWRRNAP